MLPSPGIFDGFAIGELERVRECIRAGAGVGIVHRNIGDSIVGGVRDLGGQGGGEQNGDEGFHAVKNITLASRIRRGGEWEAIAARPGANQKR